jgi:hypothetical protein
MFPTTNNRRAWLTQALVARLVRNRFRLSRDFVISL